MPPSAMGLRCIRGRDALPLLRGGDAGLDGDACGVLVNPCYGVGMLDLPECRRCGGSE